MTARCVVLIFILEAMGLFWALEQPQTSCMNEIPAFQLLLNRRHMWILMINMMDFGTLTKKPTKLFCSHPQWEHLHDFANKKKHKLFDQVARSMAVHWVDEQGSRKVTGKSKELRESQMYSAGYGRGVAQLFRTCRSWLANQYDKSLALRSDESGLNYHSFRTASFGPFDEWALLSEVENFAMGAVGEDPIVLARASCCCASCLSQDASWERHRMYRL